MPRVFVYCLYNLLLPIGLLLGLPAFVKKGIRRGGLARNFLQRLGIFDAETKARFAQSDGTIWMHAVSVGEVFVALKLIRAIHKKIPNQPIVLSTTTPTGFNVATTHSEHELVTVIHNPVDLPWIAAAALRKIRPSRLILVEAEIWPNLVALAKMRGIPVCLANARLSPRSESRYHTFRFLISPIFSQIDFALLPFSQDRSRWSSLGIREESIHITGSVKFDESKDLAPATEQIESLQNWLRENGVDIEKSRILLAGSTHDGEERMIWKIWKNLRKECPELLLVIVPRHQERGNEIASQLLDEGQDLTLLRDGPNRVKSSTKEGIVQASNDMVYISNTTGELRAWYHLAEVVLIGKSFGDKKGGQNPVEPVLMGKPVIVGPNMQNFTDVITDLLRAEGITQVENSQEAEEAILQFLQLPELGQAQSKRGKMAMQSHLGASERSAELLLS